MCYSFTTKPAFLILSATLFGPKRSSPLNSDSKISNKRSTFFSRVATVVFAVVVGLAEAALDVVCLVAVVFVVVFLVVALVLLLVPVLFPAVEEGVTDFEQYAVKPGTTLISDGFVDDNPEDWISF